MKRCSAPRSVLHRSLTGPRAFVCTSVLLLGCTQTEAASKAPPVFGGQGAKVTGYDEKPLPATETAADAAGPCGREAPASETALLDDFEDGDKKVFQGFEREGYWFTTGDKTPGSVAKPAGEFAAELLPTAEATKENRYAAHLFASGQTKWGALWGTQLAWLKNGVRCPLNLSRFSGVRFRAKGPGNIQVTFSMPEVMAKEFGGMCTDRCYDFHAKGFALTNRWETYTAQWDQLQQGGWGVEARFRPQHVVHFGIKVELNGVPADFWVDDISFIPKDANARTAQAQ